MKGFTLLELLIVIALIAVLATGAVMAINPAKRVRQANDTRIKTDISQIATALESYFTTNRIYPQSLGNLVPHELKSIPLPPAGDTYNYSRTAVCSELSCGSSLSYPLEDPAIQGGLWCWRSISGQAVETASGCSP